MIPTRSLVGQRPAELSAAEIDARYLIAIRPVTVGAGVPKRAATVLDVESCGVLSRKRSAGREEADGDEDDCRGGAPHVRYAGTG